MASRRPPLPLQTFRLAARFCARARCRRAALPRRGRTPAPRPPSPANPPARRWRTASSRSSGSRGIVHWLPLVGRLALLFPLLGLGPFVRVVRLRRAGEERLAVLRLDFEDAEAEVVVGRPALPEEDDA